MCYIISITLLIALIILFIKHVNTKSDLGNCLLDLEDAYKDLKTDQFERGHTDIGGMKAKYFTKKKAEKEKMLDEYVKKVQATRKKLGKEPIIYSNVNKTWDINKEKDDG